jgi:hypothetical protein
MINATDPPGMPGVPTLGRHNQTTGSDALDVAVCGDENPWS